ncbi:MAG: hypothetical protein FJ087_22455 [Deltaproteobacteria bacterium]|nr:hypothetical protein [Deltaproteobacteria bacterium]
MPVGARAALSPDGRDLALGRGSTVPVLDSRTREERHRIACGRGVRTPEFSADSRFLDLEVISTPYGHVTGDGRVVRFPMRRSDVIAGAEARLADYADPERLPVAVREREADPAVSP